MQRPRQTSIVLMDISDIWMWFSLENIFLTFTAKRILLLWRESMLIYGIIFPRWRVAADVSLGSWKIFKRFLLSLFMRITVSADLKCYTAPGIIPLLFLSPSLISFKSSFGHSLQRRRPWQTAFKCCGESREGETERIEKQTQEPSPRQDSIWMLRIVKGVKCALPQLMLKEERKNAPAYADQKMHENEAYLLDGSLCCRRCRRQTVHCAYPLRWNRLHAAGMVLWGKWIALFSLFLISQTRKRYAE